MTEPVLTGRVIGNRYRVLSVLGEGAMGTVYLADDLHIHRQVALKLLRHEWVARPDVRQRLEQECRIMARLGSHTNIVTLYDRLEWDGAVILLMEYVAGETVCDVVDRMRRLKEMPDSNRKITPNIGGASPFVLQISDIIRVVLQCLDALDAAHSRGILHRDIKPCNIILTLDHRGEILAKVMDFGIAKLIAGDDSTAHLPPISQLGAPSPGTPAYMAPEQIDPKRFGPVGPAADVYALGVSMYEMLTLQPPFSGTYTELLIAHTSLQPPDPRQLNPAISPELAQVLLKSLRKEPAQRYSNARNMTLDLQVATLPGTTLPAPPRARSNETEPAPFTINTPETVKPTPEEPSISPSVPAKGAARAIAAALVAIVAAALLWWVFFAPAQQPPDGQVAGSRMDEAEEASEPRVTPMPGAAPSPAPERQSPEWPLQATASPPAPKPDPTTTVPVPPSEPAPTPEPAAHAVTPAPAQPAPSVVVAPPVPEPPRSLRAVQADNTDAEPLLPPEQDITPTDRATLEAHIVTWNQAHAAEDASSLVPLLAPQIHYYTRTVTPSAYVKDKARLFETHKQFEQSIITPIEI